MLRSYPCEGQNGKSELHVTEMVLLKFTYCVLKVLVVSISKPSVLNYSGSVYSPVDTRYSVRPVIHGLLVRASVVSRYVGQIGPL